VRAAARRVLLELQRRLAWIPAPLRSRARALFAARLESDAAVDDWSRPLVGPTAIYGMAWPDAPAEPGAERDGAGSGGAASAGAQAISGSSDHSGGADLRCLLVTESLDASGMDEFVAFLARRLRKHGIATAVMIGSDDPAKGIGALGRDLAAEGIEVADPGIAGGAEWMRAWRPDVLSVHGSADWPLEAAAELGVPAVETLHGMHNLFGAPEQQVVRRRNLVAALVSVSEMVRLQYLALDRGLDPQRIITIPNGVDSRRAQTVPRDRARQALGLTDEFLFLSLARHSLQKNGYALASAFDEVAAAVPGAHLLICGRADDRSYAAQVVALRRRLPHGDRLHLRGNTPHIATLLAAADAFALDSFFEGWSLSSMEALGAGLPVVMSDVGGAREQLAGGPAKGALVANPLGDPLAVDWASIGAARFREQANRRELVAAMTALARGTMPLDARPVIAADSLARFDDELCVRRHAHAIAATANGRPIELPHPLVVESGADGSAT
jgi:glycosyltransferase involved in cell wall biosynthesis